MISIQRVLAQKNCLLSEDQKKDFGTDVHQGPSTEYLLDADGGIHCTNFELRFLKDMPLLSPFPILLYLAPHRPTPQPGEL